MSKFLPTSGFKWTDSKEFNFIKYTSNSSKGCTSKSILNILKLQELHNDYPLHPDNIQMKREMLSIYQLKIAGNYNISTSNVKKLNAAIRINSKFTY